MKKTRKLMLTKETLRSLTSPLLARDMEAIVGGTVGTTGSSPNDTRPCCTYFLPGGNQPQVKVQVQRKPRGQQR
jgi:hypothetical protein